jgi:hypothetical protein
MAMKLALLLATSCLALAACRAPDTDGLGTAVQAECTRCVDPESTTDQSYVSIGVIPARYPIDWSTPNQMYITSIGASLGFVGWSLWNPHGIGHVLLKVRCGSGEPFYVSQTGANGSAALQFFELSTKRTNMLFKTFDDGKLYDDDEAEDDWIRSVNRQRGLGDPGTYESDPKRLRDKDLKAAKADALIDKIKALPKATRRHFVRATIRINDAQCQAIRTWRDAYVETGGSTRYAVHRAPWIMDAAGKYDGGGCGSVSFAGAFYASGLDYKAAAARVTERPQIGTGRLTSSIARDGRKLDGWYLLQRAEYYTPGSVQCAKTGAACTASTKPWLDPLYDRWSGPEDVAGLHSIRWPAFGAVGGGPVMVVNSTTVPLVAFEPEKFYQEIMARWNQVNYDAFGHAGWCKIDGTRVPTIVLDGRTDGDGKDRTGRKDGIKGGFDNPDSDLF